MSGWETSGRPRETRTIRGDDTVTPIEDGIIDGQPAWTGMTRFAADHPAVAAQPNRFRPTFEGDRATATKLRGMVERAAVRHSGRHSYRPSRPRRRRVRDRGVLARVPQGPGRPRASRRATRDL
jgi:hypothetical protein